MELSASQAAKKVGKSVPTITRAIKKGKLTAKPRDGGGWIIDAAELFRVWPAVSNDTDVTLPMLGSEAHIEFSALAVCGKTWHSPQIYDSLSSSKREG